MAWTPQHDRLKRQITVLDEVLTDYGISPHPSLVIPVEGATEMFMMKKAMQLLHVPVSRNYIELFDIGGINRDYAMLARFVAVPELGAAVGANLVRLRRPLTRFMVVTDAESDFEMQAGRDKKKQEFVSAIFANLPAAYQTPAARTEIDGLVEVDTWTQTESFEFAHFTDVEIAAGIRAAYQAQGRPVPPVAPADIAPIRARRGNLKTLFKTLPAPALDKLKLAEALWPTLQAHLDSHVRQGTVHDVPIGRVLGRAVQLASLSFRRGVALQI